uniref:Homeobox-leucine zipper protein HDG5 n=1 Tax=Lygus hesperus TaxID=30085 RepID=A0A0A9Z3R8_LYGHE
MGISTPLFFADQCFAPSKLHQLPMNNSSIRYTNPNSGVQLNPNAIRYKVLPIRSIPPSQRTPSPSLIPLNPSLPHHPPQFCRVGGGNSFHRHLKKSGKSFVGSPVGSAYVYYQPAALSNLMAS